VLIGRRINLAIDTISRDDFRAARRISLRAAGNYFAGNRITVHGRSYIVAPRRLAVDIHAALGATAGVADPANTPDVEHREMRPGVDIVVPKWIGHGEHLIGRYIIARPRIVIARRSNDDPPPPPPASFLTASAIARLPGALRAPILCRRRCQCELSGTLAYG